MQYSLLPRRPDHVDGGVSPMTMHFLEGQNYDCVQCGKGCAADWRVSVDPKTRRNLRDTLLELRVIQEHGAAWEEEPDGSLFTLKKADGCIFLQPDKLCGIHAEMGYAAKPVVCRIYPFELAPTPDGIFVGVSFRCTAVQQNHGRPLAVHQSDIEEMTKLIGMARYGFEPTLVHGQTRIDWEGYKVLEAFLYEQCDRVGPELAVGQAIRALGRANVNLLGPEEVKELLAAQSPGLLERDPMVSTRVDFALLVTLAYIEGLDRNELIAAIVAQEPFEMPGCNWRGTFEELEAAGQRIGPRFDSEIARYVRAILFGKQLLMPDSGPLFNSLACLYLIPKLLRLYTAAFAGGAVEPRHFYQAIDVCEMRLTTHARDMANFFDFFASALVGHSLQ